MTDFYCSYPSCSVKLKKNNVSGVCVEHSHVHPYCRCRVCAKSAGRSRRRVAENMKAVAPSGVVFGQDQGHVQTVTLPKAPWE